MLINQLLKLEFTDNEGSVNLDISDNFNTENPLFDSLAYYLGALDHYHRKDAPSIPLTTLEKLEILCKKAREYADEESEYSENYKEVKIIDYNTSYSFGNHSAKELYDDIYMLASDLFRVRLDNLYGVAKANGDIILPLDFDEIFLLNDAHIQAEKGSLKSIYTREGILLLDHVEDISENFNPFGVNKDYFWIRRDNLWGLFDWNLKQIIPFRLDFDSCELISDNMQKNIYIKVAKNGKVGILDGLLNILVVDLANDIEDIVINSPKTFLVVKKDSEKIEYTLDNLDRLSEIKSQN